MEHTILIIDMPESINGETPCKHCSLHIAEYDDYYHHYVCQDITIVDGDEWEIYKKCPLKPLVDVIPVEWIKSKVDAILKSYPNGNEETEIICKLLYEWEKENDRN